ncbi:hypothetical protein D4T97_016330 [Siminovitchia acidinfaciens]|uniref:DUF4352 domain-containing protein n=1 Tax=Siminovitchia acidinfaciens TaxID=2321395 RepID=A0A429XVB8_9BACI|nr:hypothetical protein [Siminovitchia acidinfaciens]RST72214.1 hypothetical protein D4T97_016330 [Siminovitchia acidinfaciens]
MLKKIFVVLLLFSLMLLASACGSGNEGAKKVESENQEPSKTAAEEAPSENAKESKSGSFKVGVEDQLDLKIGDTAKFDTTLGTYEITLHSAKLIGKELDGETTELDELMVLDLTVTNTSETDMDVSDLIGSLEVTDNLEGAGFPDFSGYFSSIETIEGDLAPGEGKSGQMITDVYHSEEYFLRKSPGLVAAGTTNDVIWTIQAEDAK